MKKKSLKELSNKELLKSNLINLKKYIEYFTLTLVGIVLSCISTIIPSLLGAIAFFIGLNLTLIGLIKATIHGTKYIIGYNESKKRKIYEDELDEIYEEINEQVHIGNKENIQSCPIIEEVFPEFSPNYDSNKENKININKNKR